MKDFYPNTEVVSSLPSDTGDLVLSISTTPFTDGEVALAFHPCRFSKNSRTSCGTSTLLKGRARAGARTDQLQIPLPCL